MHPKCATQTQQNIEVRRCRVKRSDQNLCRLVLVSVGRSLVLGIPLLENKKGFLVVDLGFLVSKSVMFSNKDLVHITKFQFHVFDRYEIHIQVFGDFVYAKIILSRSSSSENVM